MIPKTAAPTVIILINTYRLTKCVSLVNTYRLTHQSLSFSLLYFPVAHSGYIFIPVTRAVIPYSMFIHYSHFYTRYSWRTLLYPLLVEWKVKYVTGRRTRFWPHKAYIFCFTPYKVYIFFISRVDLAMSGRVDPAMSVRVDLAMSVLSRSGHVRLSVRPSVCPNERWDLADERWDLGVRMNAEISESIRARLLKFCAAQVLRLRARLLRFVYRFLSFLRAHSKAHKLAQVCFSRVSTSLFQQNTPTLTPTTVAPTVLIIWINKWYMIE